MTLSFLIALFIFLPLLELAVLFRIYEQTGFWATFGLVIFTGVLGGFLAKLQGMQTLRAIRRDLGCGRMPARALMDGVMILAAGILLATPGVLTDIVGFLLLAPPIRAAVRRWLRARFEARLRTGSIEASWEEPGPD